VFHTQKDKTQLPGELGSEVDASKTERAQAREKNRTAPEIQDGFIMV